MKVMAVIAVMLGAVCACGQTTNYIMPVMTGTNAPAPFTVMNFGPGGVSDYTLVPNYRAWKMFDRDNSTHWYIDASYDYQKNGAYVDIYTGETNHTLCLYRFSKAWTQTGGPCTNYTIYGSTNGTDWVVLDEKTDLYTPYGTYYSDVFEVDVTNRIACNYFRLLINSWGPDVNPAASIYSFDMWEITPPPPPPNYGPIGSDASAGASVMKSGAYSTISTNLPAENTNIWDAASDFTYQTNAGTSISIIPVAFYDGYKGSNAVVRIPGVIDSMPVVSIDAQSFFNNTTISEIVLPDSVTNVGNYAFRGMSSLTNFVFGTGVIYVAYGPFFEDSAIVTVYFRGNAPAFNADAFSVAQYTAIGGTVFRHATATGWGATAGTNPDKAITVWSTATTNTVTF